MPPELRPYAVRLALDAEQRVHDNLSGVVAQVRLPGPRRLPRLPHL